MATKKAAPAKKASKKAPVAKPPRTPAVDVPAKKATKKAAKKAAPAEGKAAPAKRSRARAADPKEVASAPGAAVPVEKPAAPAGAAERKRARRAPGAPPVEKTRVVTAGASAPRTETRGRVEKTRVVIPMDVYEPQKDAIKAPFKAHAMKWNFLGEGRGLYKREDGGVHCFTQFKDDGVHYSIWGDDKAAVGEVLSTWRALLGETGWARATAEGAEATAVEQAEKESEATKLWKLAEPQRRAGEPDFFYQKRVAEWLAKKPTS